MFCFLSAIIFNEYSAWWILACITLGLAYAFVFYRKHLATRSTFFYFLFTLRFALVSILSFLLLAPLLQIQRKRVEKPLIIIAQDNSASIKLASKENFNSHQFGEGLTQLKDDLNDHEVEALSFGDHINKGFSNSYTGQHTDVSELLSYINEQYYGKNIGAIILASDGIINKGAITGREQIIKTPVYTIALGDTIPKKDLLIANINYNKIVYLGNDYNISVHLAAFQSIGTHIRINVSTSDGQNLSSTVKINAQDWKEKLNFKLSAKKKGIQRVNVAVSPVNGEISTENNRQTLYVDVLDGREKVLILANAPHPDLKAIKQSLESNKNYESEVLLATQVPKDLSKYGVIIFHNLPSTAFPVKDILERTSAKSRWFIIGNQSNYQLLNQSQQQVALQSSSTVQEHYITFQKNFNNFSLSEETRAFLQQVAPLNSVISKYSLKSGGEVLLSKRNTEEPVFGFTDQNGIKSAFLAGEGIWRWRMENYSARENHAAFDDLVHKTVQYLNVKEDRRKLRVYPAKNRFTDNEAVFLNAELYNDALEMILDAEIYVDIRHSSGKKYSFLFSKKETFYELNAGLLPEGEYTFLAKTSYGNKNYNASGSFIVEKTNLELRHTTANHQLLYQMSSVSGGEMVYPENISSLKELIAKNEKIKTITYEDKTYEELIALKWVFFLLILLLSLEWFLRKRNGVI